jgi:hypothetical protein
MTRLPDSQGQQQSRGDDPPRLTRREAQILESIWDRIAAEEQEQARNAPEQYRRGSPGRPAG